MQRISVERTQKQIVNDRNKMAKNSKTAHTSMTVPVPLKCPILISSTYIPPIRRRMTALQSPRWMPASPVFPNPFVQSSPLGSKLYSNIHAHVPNRSPTANFQPRRSNASHSRVWFLSIQLQALEQTINLTQQDLVVDGIAGEFVAGDITV